MEVRGEDRNGWGGERKGVGWGFGEERGEERCVVRVGVEGRVNW